MALELDSIVPIGRSLDEYSKMFTLSDRDLKKSILGIGDGPASFNAELTELGGHVTSVDPIYMFSAAQIQSRFYEAIDGVINQIKNTPADWVWSCHRSPEDLRKNRENVNQLFLEDFTSDNCSRYVCAELPHLPFKNNHFELAVCSHLLFLYSDHLSLDFHLHSILELLRVADEVRIFPLVTLGHKTSPYLESIVESLSEKGYEIQIKKVEYELQKGGNKMMVITR